MTNIDRILVRLPPTELSRLRLVAKSVPAQANRAKGNGRTTYAPGRHCLRTWPRSCEGAGPRTAPIAMMHSSSCLAHLMQLPPRPVISPGASFTHPGAPGLSRAIPNVQRLGGLPECPISYGRARGTQLMLRRGGGVSTKSRRSPSRAAFRHL
jgi:hypothetical protein